MRMNTFALGMLLAVFCSCTPHSSGVPLFAEVPVADSVLADTLAEVQSAPEVRLLTGDDMLLAKELLYDRYTLADSYPYKDTTRYFQWDKIKERLAFLENIQLDSVCWAVLQNYKNRNGEAPLVRSFRRNPYGRVADTLGVERYQSVPLYHPADTLVPVCYARDGELVRLLAEGSTFVRVQPVKRKDEWLVPSRYVSVLGDSVVFHHAVFVDRHNQNTAALERVDKGRWLVRSMNPATTGRRLPPYAQPTPLGMFVLQEKKAKMIYLKDGSKELGGFAPYASRFTNGAYIHGVPVNAPNKNQIEYSPSLGTTPRSHMCVRNATSHARFIFDWAPVKQSVVFVLE